MEVGNFSVGKERERPLYGNLGDGMQIGFHLLKIVELASHDWFNGGNVREVVGELQPEGDSLLTVPAFDPLPKTGDNRISEFLKNAAVATRSPLLRSGFAMEIHSLFVGEEVNEEREDPGTEYDGPVQVGDEDHGGEDVQCIHKLTGIHARPPLFNADFRVQFSGRV